jgi:hypothetical protein
MSALRYSGALRIRVTYVDPKAGYRCAISGDGIRRTIWVGAPNCLSHAVDSSEAFDETAHAALSFADDEDSGIGDKAAATPEGWHIGRSGPNAWPRKGVPSKD